MRRAGLLRCKRNDALTGSAFSRPKPQRRAERDKTAHILHALPGLIGSLQKGNVTEIPCFRLKQTFEFQSRV
jgi:hypothetical protein